jgi:hypothetical protein
MRMPGYFRILTKSQTQNSLQGSEEVGLVISLASCSDLGSSCAPPTSRLGSILYNGPYTPVLHEQPGRPYENFTLTVPEGFTPGTAQLASSRFHLIGVSSSFPKYQWLD